jgi:hypothetical protein
LFNILQDPEVLRLLNRPCGCLTLLHVAQACEAAAYLDKLPDRMRKLAECHNARKQKNKGQTSPFAWVFDRPVELL